MSAVTIYNPNTQNNLLLNSLLNFYTNEHMNTMINIINGESRISLRIIDWFVTNYAKKYYTIYELDDNKRFKVYHDYKLKLKAYSKKRFDPFCRWDRIVIPYNTNKNMETTIGQLNFFRWAIENRIINYIEENYSFIEKDMNNNNSSSRKKKDVIDNNSKTRKKREELSVSAVKCIKKETVKIIVKFDEI
jgi:hypothetical protein|tara:strand:- start:1001 stop:1570 length:570 start_codon:yes stop_codon:yes gene_type:complete